jgi:hypothetical protein
MITSTYSVYADGQRMSVTSDWHAARESVRVLFDMLAQSHDFPRSAPVALAEAIAAATPGDAFSLETLIDGRPILFEVIARASQSSAGAPLADPFAGLPRSA